MNRVMAKLMTLVLKVKAIVGTKLERSSCGGGSFWWLTIELYLLFLWKCQ